MISALERRLRSMRNLEALNAVLLPAFFLYLWLDGGAQVGWGWRLPPMLLGSFLLLQGAAYWHQKLQGLRSRRRMSSRWRSAFSRLRNLNRLLLASWVPVLLAGFGHGWSWGDAAWSVGLWLFALAEYVNYFEVQLMHDTPNDLARLARDRSLRRAHLVRDLDPAGLSATDRAPERNGTVHP
jgi:hypothetical protein